MSATVDRLKKWLNHGADIAALDEMGNSRLHRAVIANDPEAVALLLEYGANPKLSNHEGLKPEHFSMYLDRPACSQLLELSGRQSFLYQASDEEKAPLSRHKLESLLSFTYLDHLLFPYSETIEYVSYLTASFIDPQQREEGLGWGGRFAKQIRKGEIANVSVRYVDETVGHGLFSEEDLAKGQYVGEYVGKIIEPTVGSDTSYQMKYVLDTISRKALVIDAKDGGNLLRFANHAEQANMRPVIAHLDDLIHVLFIADRDIAAGEQLCYNYGKGYWSEKEGKVDIINLS
jgi:hypothetical protein